jgi:hypothetical protein
MNNKKKKQWLYEFEAVETIRNEDGSQESKTRYFSIAKPNRRAREEGELFYAAETSRFAKAGVLPKAAWNTILSNGGGAISDLDREGYGTLLMRYRDLAFEVQTSLLKDENERTEVESEKLSEAVLELGVIGREVQAFEADQINIFENTAEAKARNRTILWWVMCLAHEKVKTDYKPVIDAKSFEDKLDLYDDLEEDVDGNNFILNVLKRTMYLITVWYLGRASTNEELAEFDKTFKSEGLGIGTEERQPVSLEAVTEVLGEAVAVGLYPDKKVKTDEVKTDEVKTDEVKTDEVKTDEVKT